MISFSLSEEQALVQSAAARFARDSLRPISRALSARRGARVTRDLDDALLDKVASLGLVQSVAAGSADSLTPHLLSTLALEEIAFGDANAAVALAAPLGFVRAVAEQGTDAQRRELLPLYSGDSHAAAAIAAAEPGLNPSGLSGLRAGIGRGPGGLTLNCRKALVPLAGRCRHFLVITRQDEALCAVVVPASAAGVRIEPPRYVMGCASLEWSDVVFDDVSLAPGMFLGGDGGCDIRRLVNGSLIAGAAILAGIAKAAYGNAVDYAKDRKVGGQVLATKQSVAMRLVDMFTDTESLSWMAWRAAGQVDKRRDATRFARLAHGRGVDVAARVTDEALQLMSGHGYMAENLMESWYRNARTVATLELALGI